MFEANRKHRKHFTTSKKNKELSIQQKKSHTNPPRRPQERNCFGKYFGKLELKDMPGSKKSKCSGLGRGFVKACTKPHDSDRQERYNSMITRMRQRLERKKKEKVD